MLQSSSENALLPNFVLSADFDAFDRKSLTRPFTYKIKSVVFNSDPRGALLITVIQPHLRQYAVDH